MRGVNSLGLQPSRCSSQYWKAAIRSPRSLLFSRLNSSNSLSLSSQGRCSSPLIIFVASSGPPPTGPCLSCAEDSRAGLSTPGGVSQECTRGPKFSSAGLLAIHSSPSLYLCLGLPRPMCRTLHLALLNFVRFARAHLSSLSRSLWMTSLPSSVSTALHSFSKSVSSANLLRVHSIPLSVSMAKMLKILIILLGSYDWFQTDSLITIVIYTKQKNMNAELVIVDCQDKQLRGEIIVDDHSYLVEIGLDHAVQGDVAVNIAEKIGKVEITLKKKDNIHWKMLGQHLESHNTFIKRTDRGLFYRKCKLISKTEVTHDTKLLCLMLPESTHLHVPTGQHVYLKQIIAGTEVVKPYTPVLPFLPLDLKEPSRHDGAYIYLMIKIYSCGLFTQALDHLQIGDYISVSNPEGNFKKSQVQTSEDLFLLAAGTGFTPMVKLLSCALTEVSCLRTVKLIFFNKTEDDILWRNQLEQLALKDERFEVQFILSQPTKDWVGKQGKISLSLLSEFVKRSKKDSKVLICICGPTPFTEQGVQYLKDLGYSQEEIHAFTA
ncbi:cytochrome b5 reductase 4 isoform X1 [Strix uralensis]|uniref:cytochrome b5 reductase 4 isoform X1 n=1 Tax=Strix uralensis TaxID=36305 RepID=UPI003DA77543